MKRISLFMFALFCAAALFTGCSDDDGDSDDAGNGNGAGNGGSGVTVLSKKITRIVEAQRDNYKDTTYYKYDSESRLSTITEADGYKNRSTTITYASDKITLTKPGSTTPQIITLKDGRATGSTDYYDNYRFTYALEYSSNGYLSKMTSNEEENKDGQWIKGTPFVGELKISNGNLQSVTSNDEDGSSVTYEYGNTPNNTNIDLWEFVMDSDDLSLLCVMGTRFKNLPSKVTYIEKDGGKTYEFTETYTYEVNAENYVTKMTVVTQETGETARTSTYTITYE